MPTHPTPPIAKKQPKTLTLHGDTRTDNYYWLRERDNPAVLAYLEAENAYTAAMMKHTEPLQEKLYQEMVGRIKETDWDVPEKIDDYYYYTRTEAGKAYKIHCRKQGNLDAPEEILLDENELAAGHNFFELGVYKISPDHRLLAYSEDTAGNETYTLRVKNLQTGQLLPAEIPNTYYSAEWANDNQTLFYTVLDEAKRPYRLYRHTLATEPQADTLIYEETDQTFVLSLRKTRSKTYLLLQSWQTNSTEVRYLAADDPAGEFQLIQLRRHKLEYSVEHHGDHFFIVTNDQAQNFRVMTAPTDNPAQENWQEFIPHRPAVKVDAVDAFRQHLVVYERENGLRQIQIIHLPARQSHRIEFPEAAYTCWPHPNPDFNSHLLRFGYASLITPDSVFDYDMNAQSRELKKQAEVLGGYDPTHYATERITAIAADGANIPISLVYKKGLKKDGQNPMVLYGYGSYGFSLDPGFVSHRFSLLERGLVFAIVHIRGGGEMGRPWYEQGKMLNKRNTFTDFIACAEHLIAQKYTSGDRLAIWGRSAGGLLVGAVVNMRPDLFKAAVAGVPFVDVITTMSDASIPLTTAEYEEWGNPAHKEEYDYLKTYSPYDNLQAQDYPHILATAGLNDPRVAYWEPAKWVAKLRTLKTNQHRLLLKTDMSVGHSGPSGRYEYLKDIAFIYAFILDRLVL
jgi:oligopeptidase B